MRPRLPLLALLLLSCGALAHDHGEHAEWYRSLKVPGSETSCCNDKDCMPTDYRFQDGVYEVPVGFMWVMVPRARVLKNVSNPTGRAVVCRHGETIFCFVPIAEGA